MAKILIIDDEKPIADLIELNLSLTGHTSRWAPAADDALKQMEDWQPDLVLLDVMLPEKDGFELISELNQYDSPIIFLTARQSVVDKVQGLRLGAEDYITKPFEPAELLARIDVVLRRAGKNNGKLQICGVMINLEERSVSRQGQSVELTAQEYSLMEVLIRNRNIALSREKLLETAWGFDFAGETRTVDIHIQRLRRKLAWESCLKTVFKYGYRLESDE